MTRESNPPRVSVDERALTFRWRSSAYHAVFAGRPTSWPGCCLLLPGSGPQDVDGQVGPNRFLLQLANGLSGRGIASLRFGKQPFESDGSPVDDFEDEYVGPAAALVDAAARVDPIGDLVIVGHSLGGHVAPLLASKLNRVAGVVVLNAHVSDLATILAWQLDTLPVDREASAQLAATLARALEATAPEQLDHWLERYLYNAKHYDAGATLGGISARLLCIGSGQDAQIPAEELEAWVNAAKDAGLPTTRHLYADLNHLCMPASSSDLATLLEPGQISEQLLDDLGAWIAELPPT